VRRAHLLVEERAGDARGVTLEGQRAIGEVREEMGRDFKIIVDDVGLGEVGLGIEDLLWV